MINSIRPAAALQFGNTPRKVFLDKAKLDAFVKAITDWSNKKNAGGHIDEGRADALHGFFSLDDRGHGFFLFNADRSKHYGITVDPNTGEVTGAYSDDPVKSRLMGGRTHFPGNWKPMSLLNAKVEVEEFMQAVYRAMQNNTLKLNPEHPMGALDPDDYGK